MKISAFIVTAIMLLVWVVPFGIGLWASLREEKGHRKWFGAIGCLAVMWGVTSFFVTSLAADCGIDIVPSRFEWPMGYADGILTTPKGMHIAGHEAADRVQVYDADWHFVRGWHVEARGGMFVLALLPDEQFEVRTSRGNSRFIYTLDGTLISSSTYAYTGPISMPASGQSRWFWSWPWMWPLIHPFAGMFTLALGLVTLVVGGNAPFRFSRRRRKEAEK